MQLDDLEQVMKIENENFSRPWTETGFFTFLIRQDTLFLIAAEGEEILGYCGVVMVQDEGDITNVSVKKDRQNPMISTIMTGTTTAIFFSIPFREGVFLKGTASPALCCPAPLSSR